MLFMLYEIGEKSFHLIGTNGFHVKSGNEKSYSTHDPFYLKALLVFRKKLLKENVCMWLKTRFC